LQHLSPESHLQTRAELLLAKGYPR